MAVQPHGKIVAAGTANRTRFALARYKPDGSLDPTSGGGKVKTRYGIWAVACAIALQPNGRAVAAGTNGYGCRRPAI